MYRDEFNYTPTLRERSASCPELCLYRVETPPPKRRRAYSESVHSLTEKEIGRVQSDTDLGRIDRQATFAASAIMEPCELLAQVVNALGNHYHSEMDLSNPDYSSGFHGFSDSQILESEKWRGSGWTIGGDRIFNRQRSYSQYTLPDKDPSDNNVAGGTTNQEWTWSGPFATKQIQEIRKKAKQKLAAVKPKNVVAKIRKPFTRGPTTRRSDVSEMTPEQYLSMTSEGKTRFHTPYNPYSTHTGVTSMYSSDKSMLEETTIADLLRAITSLSSQMTNPNSTASNTPKRKLGTASLTPPKLPSLLTLFPPQMPQQSRRSSLRPLPSGSRRMSLRPPNSVGGSARSSSRRFSVRPVDLPQYQITNEKTGSTTNFLTPPTDVNMTASTLRIPAVERVRSHSLYPGMRNSLRTAPTSRWRPDVLRNENTNGRLYKTRHDSLSNIRIDKS